MVSKQNCQFILYTAVAQWVGDYSPSFKKGWKDWTRSLLQRLDINSCSSREAALLILLVLLVGCKSSKTQVGPSIKFTRLTAVNPDKLDIIQGRRGCTQGQQIVLYAKRGEWWLQPLSTAPFIALQPDSLDKLNSAGSEYAALLVEPGYIPQPTRLCQYPEIMWQQLQRLKTFRPLTLFQQPCNSADTNGGS
jgi:hypothetical protein